MDVQFLPEGAHPAMDQQQFLLYPSNYQPPQSVSNIAEHIESSGAHVEETLSRLNCHYQSLFFFAAWATVVASILGFLASLFSLQFFSLVCSVFLFFFGSATMVLDVPGNPRWAAKYRKSVRKYIRFLTLLTGKSVWLLYLGCLMIACFLPSTNRKRSSLFISFIFLISIFVLSVASLGLFIALRKSLRLERVRQSLLNTYQANWTDIYRKYAVNDPAHGMQFEEFNRMTSDYSHGKLLFGVADLHIVYNAIDEHQKNAINESEFTHWLKAGEPGYENGSTICFSTYFKMTYL